MYTARFPKVRVTPESLATVVAALRPGETLTSFIRAALTEEATWRSEAEKRMRCRENMEKFQKSRRFSRTRRISNEIIEINISAKIRQMRSEHIAA